MSYIADNFNTNTNTNSKRIYNVYTKLFDMLNDNSDVIKNIFGTYNGINSNAFMQVLLALCDEVPGMLEYMENGGIDVVKYYITPISSDKI